MAHGAGLAHTLEAGRAVLGVLDVLGDGRNALRVHLVEDVLVRGALGHVDGGDGERPLDVEEGR